MCPNVFNEIRDPENQTEIKRRRWRKKETRTKRLFLRLLAKKPNLLRDGKSPNNVKPRECN